MTTTITEEISLDGQPEQPEQVCIAMAGGGRDLAQPDAPARSHAFAVRGLGYVPESKLSTGRFGRLFRKLEAYVPSEARIEAIAQVMAEPPGAGKSLDNTTLPAGYTYLGQFVDHDITFDPASVLDRQNDPDALSNFRTPRFDLDSVYGRGPADQPYLYDPPAVPKGAERLRIAERDGLKDLPRDDRGVALIGDPRNDENVFVNHVHLTILHFHNAVCDWLEDNPHQIRGGEDTFAAAQRIVRWHYQWIVVHDFLRRITDRDTYDDILRHEELVPGGRKVEQPRLRFFSWQQQVFMPVEFAVAAYRFGHSLVRPVYKLNTTVPALPIFTPTSAHDDPLAHWGGFRPLPRKWQVEWRRFFEVGQADEQNPLQLTRKIDRMLAGALLNMPAEQIPPGSINNLAKRNLTRGARLGLPSGQSVARAMGLEPLSDDELALPQGGPAPLWYYVLREAEIQQSGERLGRVGSRIVAEVFLGLLVADPSSYLSNEPGWKPFLQDDSRDDFTMPDLIEFSGFGLQDI
jgi:Animal haem peroxidase